MKRMLVLLLCAVAWAACVPPPYHPPSAGDPHAIVKVRRVYEARQGTSLNERFLVEEHSAFSGNSHAAETGAPRVDVVLIHPRSTTLEFSATFFHMETRTVQESYTVQVPYSTSESYSCGSYSSGHYSPRTCTRTVTRYRSETRFRWVTRSVEVIDGACAQALRIAPEVGHNYLIQYTYQGSSICHMSCFEQIPGGDGHFQNRACPAPVEEGTSSSR